MKHFPTMSLFSSVSSLRKTRLILAGFVGKVCVCIIVWSVQCRQEHYSWSKSWSPTKLKIKLLLGFTSHFVQSIVTVGRIGRESFESIFSKSSLGLNCVVQHLSFLAAGENSLGSFCFITSSVLEHYMGWFISHPYGKCSRAVGWCSHREPFIVTVPM